MKTSNQKFYLTKEGLEKFKKEYEELKKIAEIKARESVPEIFHSEEINSEYLEYQEDNELLQSRLAELKNILEDAEIIKSSRKKSKIVELGSIISVRTSRGKPEKFILVGSLEADPSSGKISNESPVGKALMGHKVGDVVSVQSAEKYTYKILDIK